MNSVQRTKGIRRIIRQCVFRCPVQKYVTAGDKACLKMVREACSRPLSGPSDKAILAWARFDLTREMISGFWEVHAT